jgi:hypothetical protein
MSNDLILIMVMILSLIGIIIFSRELLKADNSFYYVSGRSMRGLDILFAIDRDKFNFRVQHLTAETKTGFEQWVKLDIWLAPVFNLFVVILLVFVERAYPQKFFHIFFITLIIAQVFSFIAHIVSDLILLNSLHKQKMTASMRLFNVLVVVKMFFPVLGVFISFATLVLVWFRFLNSLDEPLAALVFFVPAALIIAGLKILKKKSPPELT